MKWKSKVEQTAQKPKRKVINENISCYRLKKASIKKTFRTRKERYINLQNPIEQEWINFAKATLAAAKQACGTSKFQTGSKKGPANGIKQ